MPHDGLAELAIVGRSNVGKSTLINALVRRRLARTSAAPGKTRLANVYHIARAGARPFYLVDLPGYGFAGGGPAAAREFEELTRAIFGRVGRVGQVGRVGRTNLPAPPGLPDPPALAIAARLTRSRSQRHAAASLSRPGCRASTRSKALSLSCPSCPKYMRVTSSNACAASRPPRANPYPGRSTT